MELLKRYLVIVISGAVSVLAIVALAIGHSKISGLRGSLSQAEQLDKQIETLRGGVLVQVNDRPVRLIPNQDVVEQRRNSVNQGSTQGDKSIREELTWNIGVDDKTGKTKRTLLLEGVFPSPVSEAEPFGFPPKYRQALKELLKEMGAGDVPSDDDIRIAEEEIRQSLGQAVFGSSDRTGKREALFTPEKLKRAARERAANQRAQSIKIYANIDSLDRVGTIYEESGKAPSVEDMWWAQLSLWLQQDIVAAIVEINGRDTDGNIDTSAVKRLDRIEVQRGYDVVSGDTATIVPKTATGIRDDDDSFTGIMSNEVWDVTRFKIEMIVDIRRIPDFIDALYRQSHYVLYYWDMETPESRITQEPDVKSSTETDLYRYGTEPIAKLTACFEACLMRDFYHWGIVGYGNDEESGKPYVRLYTGQRQILETEDQREQAGLKGLMPKSIRDEITDAEKGTVLRTAGPARRRQ